MLDNECRTSHVRIIENTSARAVVHWRYAVRAADYSLYPDDGLNYWADEYYYIHLDQTMIRFVDWHSQSLAFHDNNLVISPNHDVEDLIDVNSVILFSNDQGQIESYQGLYSHWPVSQANSDGIGAYYEHSNTRVRSFSMGANDEMGEGSPPVCFWGFTDQDVSSLSDLRKSWNSAPDITSVEGGIFEQYELESRSYILKKVGKDSSISFDIKASEDCPLRNVCFVIKDWDPTYEANLIVEGKMVSNLKQGLTRDTTGSANLIIFYEIASNFGTTSFEIIRK